MLKIINKSILLLLLTISALSFSQQEASVWYFGLNAGIKFDPSGAVTPLTDGQLYTSEGCATIADTSGNLLFYTDGVTVYNRNHGIMPNGTGLTGDSSTTQSATIVQKPGTINLFYIFTLDSFAGANGFRYSVVDITLDGGLGAITTEKNILVYTPSNEKIAIVKHPNNIDFWVVTHGWNNNIFYSYLLTSTGLSAIPVISNVGLITDGITENAWGYMKISPDGTKLAICNSHINAELLDFNSSNGVVSNPIILNTLQSNVGFNYGLEFSQNSEILYLSTINNQSIPSTVTQYNTLSSNVVGSAQIL